jgi:hypothetical protein
MVAAGTKPSAPVSSSLMKSPAFVTPEICPLNVAPMRSARKCAIRRSIVSRSAAIARRSAAEMRALISISSARVVSGRRPSLPSLSAAMRARWTIRSA